MADTSMKAIVDYLIVIPLDEEFGYIREVIEGLISRQVNSITIGSELYGRTIIPTAKGKVSAVFLSVGRMTEGPVQSAVEAAVRTWQPATVILAGIAGSFEPEKVMLGDVIIPSKVFGYTEAKASVIKGEEKISYRPTGHSLDCALTAIARAEYQNRGKDWRAASYEAGLTDEHLKPKLLEKDAGPALHIHNNDCLASGNVVVASKSFAQKVRDVFGDAGPTLKAVEMEAKGLCEALAKISSAPPALVVRGISDLADEEKSALEKDYKDGWRRYAAQNAARFIVQFVKYREDVQQGYRPVSVPVFPMKSHPDSSRLCMEAGIKAREAGMRNVAFSPFIVCEDGLPATRLTLEAYTADGLHVPFSDLLLRHSDDLRVLHRTQNQSSVVVELKRCGEPPQLDLLVGLHAEAVLIKLAALDEFNRQTNARWEI